MRFEKIKEYFAEPIIKLLSYLVFFIVMSSVLFVFTDQFVRNHYEKPFARKIINQNNKKKLASIITRELQDINSEYRAMLLSSNIKQVENISKKLSHSIQLAKSVLPVLENGGSIEDKYLVNFYDMDEVTERISYTKPDDEEIVIDIIILSPQLEVLENQLSETAALLLGELRTGKFGGFENFELIMRIKQTEALLLRAKESANKIFYDIKQSNLVSEKLIEQARCTASRAVLLFDVSSTFLLVLFSLYIAKKIFTILEIQKEMDARNKMLSFVVEQSPSSIIITDTEDKIEYVNRFFIKATGYSHEDIAGKPVDVMRAGVMDDSTFKSLRKGIHSGGLWRGDLSIRSKDGSLLHNEAVIAPIFDDEQNIINFAGILLDVTETKQLKKDNIELQQEQEKLKIILNKTPVGAVVIGKDKKLLWANENALSIIKKDFTHEIYAANCFDIMKCHREQGAVCPYIDNNVSVKNTEWSFKGDEGNIIPVLLSIQHISWGGEEVVLETFIDISERKEAELALESSNIELKDALEKLQKVQTQLIHSEKMASIGLLAAGVAHEINNPTGFISSNLSVMTDYIGIYKKLFGQLENLKNAITLDDSDRIEAALNDIAEIDQQEDVSFILDDSSALLSESYDGTRRIKEIVKGLRNFARQDSFEFQNTSINRAIENALKLTWNELKYNCEIKSELGDIPEINGREDQLTQVFVNLLVNASHAISGKGMIGIKTWGENGYIFAEISDTGKGIPDEVIPKLFDPFFTTKDVGTGTGLGLSISHGIIKEHGGEIKVESTPGVGTSFRIKFRQ